MSLDRGTKLGPYEVLDPLGAGGMGEVYKARDTRLDRTVAINVLPAEWTARTELRQRLDFGVAGIREAKKSDGTDSTALLTHDLTSQGTILGTFQYMSPEQLEGKEADARSDLFAFGAVLYEMLSGSKAFRGASQAS